MPIVNITWQSFDRKKSQYVLFDINVYTVSIANIFSFSNYPLLLYTQIPPLGPLPQYGRLLLKLRNVFHADTKGLHTWGKATLNPGYLSSATMDCIFIHAPSTNRNKPRSDVPTADGSFHATH